MRRRSLLAVAATAAIIAAPVAAFSFPEKDISRADMEYEWPFSVDRGTLACVELFGQRTVLFSEPWRDDVPQELGNMTPPRSVIVSSNPFALFASYEDRALYLPFDSLETLVLRLAPFERMGLQLCDEDKASRGREI